LSAESSILYATIPAKQSNYKLRACPKNGEEFKREGASPKMEGLRFLFGDAPWQSLAAQEPTISTFLDDYGES
jgi:hypothetical protein